MAGAIAKAICKVMAEVRFVTETGYNQHNKYRYASDADLLVALQPAMARNGLALVPTDVSCVVDDHGQSKAGAKRYRTDIIVTYALIHESGEQITVKAPGCGLDQEDKGVYKAMTGALKYALRHLFLVPTGDDAERSRYDDLEATSATPEPAPAPAPAPAPEAPRKAPPEDEWRRSTPDPSWERGGRERFMAGLAKLGWEYEPLCAWLDEKGWPRPSSMGMTDGRRQILLSKLADEWAVEFGEWLDRYESAAK